MSGVDRISQLPDEIIQHILSFLPTTNHRARTSILSRRWRHIWTHHPSIHLSLSLPSGAGAGADNDARAYTLSVLSCIQSCIDPLLLLHKFSVDLWLPTSPNPADEIHAKVADLSLRFAGLRSVRQLRIHACHHPYAQEVPKLPGSLFCCDSLTDLNLFSSTFPNVPSDFPGFLFLKTLHLYYGSISDDDLHHLLDGCPLLETLHVVGCAGPTYVDVNLPNLTDLVLNSCEEDFIGARIEAPNLRSITYGGDLQCLYLRNSPVLLKAALRYDFEFQFDTQEDFMTLLFTISNINVLLANNWFYKFEFTKPTVLNNLKELYLYIDDIDDELTDSMLKILVTNIGECPVLEKLDISFNYVRDSLDLDDWDAIVKQLEEDHQKDGCNTPEIFGEQRCFLWHLKTVILGEFLGSKNQMRLVTFLLGNAVALENFIVFDFLERDEEELQELFASIPKASSQVHMKLSLLENQSLKGYYEKGDWMFL